MGRLYNIPAEGKSFAELGSGFNITGTNPIDNRLAVKNMSDIDGVQCGAYEGMVVYVQHDSLDNKPVLKMCTKVDSNEPGKALEWADVAPKIEFDTEAMHYRGSLNYENWVQSWKNIHHEYGDVWYISDENGLQLPAILDILTRYVADSEHTQTTDWEKSLVWDNNGSAGAPDKISFNGSLMTGKEFLNYYLTAIKTPYIDQNRFDSEYQEIYDAWAEAYDELKVFKFPIIADAKFIEAPFISKGETGGTPTYDSTYGGACVDPCNPNTSVITLDPGTMVIYTKNLGTKITKIPSVVPYYWEYVKSSNTPICDKIGFQYDGSVPAITNTNNLTIPNTTGSFKNLDDVLETIIAKVWYTAPKLTITSRLQDKKWYVGETYSFSGTTTLPLAKIEFSENSGKTNSNLALTFNITSQDPTSINWAKAEGNKTISIEAGTFYPTDFTQGSLTIATLTKTHCTYTNADGAEVALGGNPKFTIPLYFKYFAQFTKNALTNQDFENPDLSSWNEAGCGNSLQIDVKTGTNTQFLTLCIPSVFLRCVKHTNQNNDTGYDITGGDVIEINGQDYRIWRVSSSVTYSPDFEFNLTFDDGTV